MGGLTLNKIEAIEKIREMQNGIITVKIEDDQVVSTSIQQNDMDYREG